MARDPYKDMPRNINESPSGSFPIVPDDNVDLPLVIRKLTIGVSGTVAWQNHLGESYTTGQLAAGDYEMRAARIMATGTTATNLTGWV